MWFKELVGFDEKYPENVRNNISIDGTKLISKINGRSFQFGSLEIPTLGELKKQASSIKKFEGKIHINELVGDVQKMHCE